MNVFAFSGLTVCISCLSLAVLTIILGDTRLHRQLFFFNIAVAIWGFGLLLVGIASSPAEALVYWKIALVGGFFVSPLFFHFTTVYCNKSKPKLLIFAYGQAVLTLIVDSSTNTFLHSVRLVDGIYFPQMNPFLAVAVILYFSFVALSYVELWLYLPKATGHHRLQTLYNIFGFMVGFLGGTSTFIPMFGVDLVIPYGNLGITLYVLILTYAIFRHNLMEFRPLFRRTVIYIISIGIITALFVVLVLTVTNLLSFVAGVKSSHITIVAAIIVAFIFNPLKTKVEAIVERVFFKSIADYALIMKDMTNMLAVKDNPTEIRELIAELILTSFQLKGVNVFLRNDDEYALFYSAFNNTEDNPSSSLTIPVDSALIALLQEKQGVLRKRDYDPDMSQNKGIDSTILASFDEHEIIIPIFIENDLVDLFMLREKIDGDFFSHKDIILFQVISNNLSISLRKAVLYEELAVQVRENTREIEERKQLEEEKDKLQKQLSQAQRLESIGRLAGGVAHDFNNNLTAIVGYSEIILANISHNHRFHDHVKNIYESGMRASGLTRQLLAFSRKQMLNMQSIDIADIFNNLSKILIRLIGEDISFEVHAGKIGSVWADTGQMEQVLMNLALNSRDAMPDGGKIIIRLSEERVGDDVFNHQRPAEPDLYVKIEFEDTGFGMSSDLIENIFEPFFTTKKASEGTGLGLATAHGIISQHDGYIFVDSVVGEGTCFTIYLPVYETEQKIEKKVEMQKSFAGGSETILVVEDNLGVRKLSIKILTSLGYHLLEAESGEEALSKSDKYTGTIDLLLTDVVMPGMNGRELAEQFILKRPDVKVVFMSGYTDDIIIRHGVLEPGLIFINKPLTILKLSETIRSALDADRTDSIR